MDGTRSDMAQILTRALEQCCLGTYVDMGALTLTRWTHVHTAHIRRRVCTSSAERKTLSVKQGLHFMSSEKPCQAR